jgi:hypothetical protein
MQPKPGSKKVSVDELRKKEKECRRLKHELSTEKEKFNQMVAKFQADLQTLQVGNSTHCFIVSLLSSLVYVIVIFCLSVFIFLDEFSITCRLLLTLCTVLSRGLLYIRIYWNISYTPDLTAGGGGYQLKSFGGKNMRRRKMKKGKKRERK